MSFDDGYNAEDNGSKCYTLAIRSIRLERIRAGLSEPNLNDPEEMEAARESGVQIVQPEHHRRSA